MIQNFAEDYNSPVPFVRFYFRRIMCEILKMLKNFPSGSLILDFGCGRQYLKIIADFKNIIGYDVISELSDTRDYRYLKPDIIICNHVLEHLDVEELKEALDNFRKMQPLFIITGIPTENLLSRFCAMIGRPHGYFEHKSKMKLIHDELGKRFTLLESKNIFTLTILSKWK